MFKQTLGDSASRMVNTQILLARIKCYEGDYQAAREVATQVIEGQAAAQAAGKTDSLVTPGERLLVDTVDLALRRGADAEFDALLAKARELTLQPGDIVEVMELKGLSALRSGRRADGIRFLEEAFAESEKNAKLVSDRIRRQLRQAAALAAS